MNLETLLRRVGEIHDTGQGDQIITLLTAPDDDALRRETSVPIVAMIGALLGDLPEIAEVVLDYHERIHALDGTEEGRRAIQVCHEAMYGEED